MSRIAVIGAGLSGLVLARDLADQGDVVIFDKARGVGGRMATRYAGDYEFDHGAQFFTARSRRFQNFLEPLLRQNVVAPWHARFVELTGDRISASRDWGDDHPHYVGVPRMNALAKLLAADLDVQLSTRATGLRRQGRFWRVLTDGNDDRRDFDWIVLSAPAPQSAALLPAGTPLFESAAGAAMRACYALMLGIDAPPDFPWQAARVLGSDLSWISVNSSKPGRSGPATLVVHSTNAWADEHLEDDQDDVRAHLLGEVERVSGIGTAGIEHVALHRWRYANLPTRRDEVRQIDPERRLAVCGDWCLRGRVEAAYLSAARLADALREYL